MRMILAALSCAAFSLMAHAADVEFKLVTLKNVNDVRELGILRDELFLGEEKIDRALVTDILNDGFDENDFVQLFPSGRVLRLAPITARLDSLLRSYRLPPNVEIHETRQYFGRYDSLAYVRSGGQSLGYGILGGLSERLSRGYRGDYVEGYFRFSNAGHSVMAWNFDSTKVNFPPPQGPRVDTIMVYVHDTVFVPEIVTVTQEPIITRDTVYIPENLLRNPRGLYYRYALGTLGGGYSMAKREASRGRIVLGAGNEWDFGVWDRWISGRQDIRSRVGLRFVAEMSPWKTDTLSARFLGTSFETMYIPAWDRSFFAFAGARAIYHDDLFWDATRAAWDEDFYDEAAGQDLAQYELTVKLGLDKFAPYGGGKKLGAWLKLSGWFPGGHHSGYDVMLDQKLAARISPDSGPIAWHWQHDGGVEVEAAMTTRLGETAQMVVSLGELSIPNLHYEFSDTAAAQSDIHEGLLRVGQFYQTAAIRFAPYNSSNTRLMLDASFRNNILTEKIKKGADETALKEIFFPYMEAPEISGGLRLDVSIVRIEASVRYFMPSGEDAQVRPEGSVYLLFR